jgi:hypothetical protein
LYCSLEKGIDIELTKTGPCAHKNTYIIILIDDKGALLKQNFGLGTTLSEAKKDRVPLTELEKI